MKQIVRLTESDFHQFIHAAVRKALNEAIDPVAKIQALIQQANNAYHKAQQAQDGDEWPLMNRNGEIYGLSGDIRLDGRGYITIPFTAPHRWSEYASPEKIRVLTKAGGKIRIIQGDYFDEGWKDAAKYLKKIIKDAEIGIGYFQNYDSSWETASSPEEYKANHSALKDLNKKIGRNVSTGKEYIEKSY